MRESRDRCCGRREGRLCDISKRRLWRATQHPPPEIVETLRSVSVHASPAAGWWWGVGCQTNRVVYIRNLPCRTRGKRRFASGRETSDVYERRWLSRARGAPAPASSAGQPLSRSDRRERPWRGDRRHARTRLPHRAPGGCQRRSGEAGRRRGPAHRRSRGRPRRVRYRAPTRAGLRPSSRGAVRFTPHRLPTRPAPQSARSAQAPPWSLAPWLRQRRGSCQASIGRSCPCFAVGRRDACRNGAVQPAPRVALVCVRIARARLRRAVAIWCRSRTWTSPRRSVRTRPTATLIDGSAASSSCSGRIRPLSSASPFRPARRPAAVALEDDELKTSRAAGTLQIKLGQRRWSRVQSAIAAGVRREVEAPQASVRDAGACPRLLSRGCDGAARTR